MESIIVCGVGVGVGVGDGVEDGNGNWDAERVGVG